MSNLIFPSSVGQSTVGTNRWGYRLPFKKTPSFKTLVQTSVADRGEVRISVTPFPIWKYELDLAWMRGDLSPAQVGSAAQQIIGFMSQVKGAYDDWLFTDDNDNTVTQATGVFGYGGGQTQFQLQRQVGGLLDIIQNPKWTAPPSIYVNGVLQTPFTGSGVAAVYNFGQENLLLQSQELEVSPTWSVSNLASSNPSVTADSVASPDGTVTACTITFPDTTGGGKSSTIFQNTSVGMAGQQFCFSIWLKAASGSGNITIALQDFTTGQAFTTVVTPTASWVRYNVVGTFDLLASGTAVVSLVAAGNVAVGVYAWGAQLERCSDLAGPTGYLPTTTAQSIPNGLVTFATAPASMAKLTWSGTFFNRCRFEDDEWLGLEEYVFQIWRISSLKFRTVIL